MYDIQTTTIVIVSSMIFLMMVGIPLGIVTLTVSIGTALAYFGLPGLFLVASNSQGLLEAYPLIAVPLFVLMANILERSGVAEDLFDAMSIIAGGLRGGVAVQTTLVAVLMAAMTGIMGGEIVMLGLIALPQMLRLGYDKKLAMGTICAGGSLATLIPPSVIMIIYGLTANVSISDLFLGGFLPGFLLASLYVTYIMVRCQIQPHLAPLPAEGLVKMGSAEKNKEDERADLAHAAHPLGARQYLWRHRHCDGSGGGRRLWRNAGVLRTRQVHLGDASGCLAQNDDNGWHDHLAGSGRG
jgi:TRAP-type mannitol/chloroaromatic compound transport system permease large subunit